MDTLRTPEDLGALLKKRRQTLGLTQKTLSLQTGISVPTIIAVERGNDRSGVGVVLALCEGLGITLSAEA